MGCVLLPEVVMEEMTSLLALSRHKDPNPRGRTVFRTSYISKHREPVICHIHRDTHMFIHTYTGINTQYVYTCACTQTFPYIYTYTYVHSYMHGYAWLCMCK